MTIAGLTWLIPLAGIVAAIFLVAVLVMRKR